MTLVGINAGYARFESYNVHIDVSSPFHSSNDYGFPHTVVLF